MRCVSRRGKVSCAYRAQSDPGATPPAGGVTTTRVDIIKGTMPEDMGMANISTKVSHDANKVHL